MNVKRASLWVALFGLLGFGVYWIERHSNNAVEERVRIEAAARCGGNGGVWK